MANRCIFLQWIFLYLLIFVLHVVFCVCVCLRPVSHSLFQSTRQLIKRINTSAPATAKSAHSAVESNAADEEKKVEESERSSHEHESEDVLEMERGSIIECLIPQENDPFGKPSVGEPAKSSLQTGESVTKCDAIRRVQDDLSFESVLSELKHNV